MTIFIYIALRSIPVIIWLILILENQNRQIIFVLLNILFKIINPFFTKLKFSIHFLIWPSDNLKYTKNIKTEFMNTESERIL